MRFFGHFSQSFSLYRAKLEIKISFLLAFFAYIHTFVEWYIVHINVDINKNATPMESRFIVLSFYLTIWDYSQWEIIG